MAAFYLVLSDSHGRKSALLEVVRRQKAAGITPEGVIFLGDGLGDMALLPPEWPLWAVRGNCDPPSADAPPERRLVLSGKCLYLAHGHTLGVKHGLVQGIAAALEKQADVFLFGHTHDPVCEVLGEGQKLWGVPMERNLLYMNPGSLFEGSFGILTVDGGTVLGSHGRL